MLEVRAVSRHFGGVIAVDAVSMAVARGEIVGLIGPNGAGKTTLFDCIAGTVRASDGAILLDGNHIEREAAHARLVRGLGRASRANSGAAMGRAYSAWMCAITGWMRSARSGAFLSR